MPRWLKALLTLGVTVSTLLSAAALTVGILAYAESVETGVEPVTIEVIQVEDAVLASSQLLLGEWQQERQQWEYLVEKQGSLIGLFSDRLVEEIRANKRGE